MYGAVVSLPSSPHHHFCLVKCPDQTNLMACPSGHQHTHYGTPTKHEKEGHLAPPCSIAFYESLTSEPINEFESKAPDGSCSPMLDSITAIGPDDAVASVSSAVLTRTPLCPYITVTGSDGTRVYMKFQQTEVSRHPITTRICV